jgi:molybdopterin biosynthesis enzyme
MSLAFIAVRTADQVPGYRRAGGTGHRHCSGIQSTPGQLFTTGDELVTIEKQPQPGQIRDINSFSMAALTRQYGGSLQCQ